MRQRAAIISSCRGTAILEQIMRIAVYSGTLLFAAAVLFSPAVLAKTPVQSCDLMAANPRNPTRVSGAAGVEYGKIDIAAAITVCEAAIAAFPLEPRFQGMLSALYYLKGDYQAALVMSRAPAEAGDLIAMDVLASLYLFDRVPGSKPEDARRWFSKAAGGGFPESDWGLGYMAEYGIGEPKNVESARNHYRKAGEGGFNEAMMALADNLYLDSANSQAQIEAGTWYKRAADRGHLPAIKALASLYFVGRGVAQNDAESVHYYRLAAEAGDADSMSELAWMYSFGRGVPKDFAQSFAWNTRSAAAGSQVGMSNLGWAYYRAQGVAEDKKAARSWFEKAAATGNGFGLYSLAYVQEEGAGGPVDHKSAAENMLKALAARDAYANEILNSKFKDWSAPFIAEVQETLRREGQYRATTTGKVDDATLSAVAAYIKAKAAP